MAEEKRTELSELGEFGLIRHLTQHLKIKHESTVFGVGDDAAVLNLKNKQTVITTDMLMEGVHFNLSYVPFKHLGYKAIVVNLSDVYAMNAIPEQITVSIAVSNRFPVEVVEEIYAGMFLACEVYGIDMIGGDTTSSAGGMVLSITAVGQGTEGDIVYRSGAKENDLIVVSGDLGGAYVGLQVLERERSVWEENPDIQPDLAGHDYILERQLKPEARKDVIELLKKLEVKPTAMIDISDGLGSELMHICTQSGVGCLVYDDKLPIDPITYQTATEFGLDPTTCVLNGGEDYELLFTVDIADHDKIKGNPNLTIIGHITDAGSGINLVDKNGGQHDIKAQGWDAFSKPN